MAKTKAEVQKELRLDQPPDDEFMALLEAAGEGDVVAGPAPSDRARAHTGDEVEEEVIKHSVGALLAEARKEAEQSLGAAAKGTGLSRSRVHQVEKSDNIEVTTLVRLAGAYGYEVHIDLKPTRREGRALHAVLAAAGA